MSIEADVQININATDNASAVVDTATRRINKSWINLRNQQRAVNREFELNNRTLVSTGRLLTSIGSIVQRVISIYNTWQLLQIRNSLATKNLRDAQRDLQDTFLEFGGTSKEFQLAQERIKEAQEEMQRNANETLFVYALMVVGILTQLGRLTKIIPQLKKFGNAIKGVRGSAGVSAPVPVQKTLTSTGSITGTKPPTTPTAPKAGGGGFLSGLKAPAIGAGASAGLFLATLAGEKQAFGSTAVINPETGEVTGIDEEGEEVKTSIDQIARIASDIEQRGREARITVNNFINSPTPQGMLDSLAERIKQAMTFGNQSTGSA